MSNFVGHYFFLVDESFRLAVPSSYRKLINEEPSNILFLFPGPEKTIHCFPQSSWQEFRNRLEKTYNPQGKPISLRLSFLTEHTWETKMDAQGRILINEYLREYAEITAGSEVVIRGFETHFGITSRKNYEREMKEKEFILEEIWKEMVAEKGFLKDRDASREGEKAE